MGFSVAQAFTPGLKTGGVIKAPLMGLLNLTALLFPGVNAWATEKVIFRIKTLSVLGWKLNSEPKSVTLTHRFFELLARKESQHAQPISVVGYQTSHR